MKKTLLKSMFVGGLLTLSMGAQAQNVGDVINFNGADYAVKSANIVVNGSFDNGVDGWYAGNWADANASNYILHSDGGFDNGAYLEYSAGGAGAETNIRNKWQVEKGKTYLFRCYTSGKTPTSNNFQYSFLAVSDNGETEGAKLYQLKWGAAAEQETSEWCLNDFVFTAESDWVLFRSSWTTSTKLDGFFLGEVTISMAGAKAELEAEIKAAEDMLANNEDFTEGVDEFKAAISEAKSALDNATNIEQINAAIEALKAAEKAFMAANMFSYQKYILVNTSSKKFWGAANNWGTRASLVEHPEYVMLVPQPDGKYYLESQVSNGGTSYYFNGDYMDNGSPVKLTIKRNKKLGYAGNEEKIPVYDYTIANDGKYYGWDGESTILGKELTASDEKALWVIVSLDEAKAFLSEATAEDPMDATFLIEDHNFGRNNRNHNKWTYKSEKADGGTNFNISGGEDGQGSIGNNCAESFHAKFEISQTLADAPAGDYELTAQGFYREDEVEGESTIDLPVFFANDATATFPVRDGEENSMSAAGTSFLTGKYTIEPIKFTVTEAGKLTIGARLVESTNLWCIFDNFVLWYYGPGETVGITTLKAEKSCDSAIYNLQGQRVEKAAKGIYIQNGKKYLVK